MTAEGIIGLIAGFAAGSIALVGWALGSGIEGLASVIVVWRFTGPRMLSETAGCSPGLPGPPAKACEGRSHVMDAMCATA